MSTDITYDQNLISKTIDWLRFPMAVLVVFIHADGALISDGYTTNVHNGLLDVLTIIFSQGLGRIAVPVFFFISGYLFFKGLSDWDSKVWLGKERKRIKTLLVPYLLWNIIATFAFVAFWMVQSKIAGYQTNPVELISSRGWLRVFWDSNITDSGHFVNVLGVDMNNIFPMDYPLWFVRDLMILTLFAPLIYLMVKYAGILFIGLSGLMMIFDIGFPFNANFTTGFFYFLFGAYYMIKGKNFLQSFSKIKITSVLLLITSLVAVSLTYNNPPYQVLGKIFVNVVSLSGLVTVFNISASLMSRERIKVNKFLSESSFFIFATQAIYFESLVAVIVRDFVPGSGEIMLSFKYFLIVALTVALLLGLYSLMKKILPRTTNVLMGSRG